MKNTIQLIAITFLTVGLILMMLISIQLKQAETKLYYENETHKQVIKECEEQYFEAIKIKNERNDYLIDSIVKCRIIIDNLSKSKFDK